MAVAMPMPIMAAGERDMLLLIRAFSLEQGHPYCAVSRPVCTRSRPSLRKDVIPHRTGDASAEKMEDCQRRAGEIRR